MHALTTHPSTLHTNWQCFMIPCMCAAHETDGLLASDGGSDCDADDEEAGARNVSPSAMSSGLATSMQKVLHSRPSSQSDGNSGSGGGYLPSEL